MGGAVGGVGGGGGGVGRGAEGGSKAGYAACLTHRGRKPTFDSDFRLNGVRSTCVEKPGLKQGGRAQKPMAGSEATPPLARLGRSPIEPGVASPRHPVTHLRAQYQKQSEPGQASSSVKRRTVRLSEVTYTVWLLEPCSFRKFRRPPSRNVLTQKGHGHLNLAMLYKCAWHIVATPPPQTHTQTRQDALHPLYRACPTSLILKNERHVRRQVAVPPTTQVRVFT